MTDTSGDPQNRTREETPDGPPAGEATQVKVVIPDDHSMVSLLGSGDELLRVVEDSFDADIHVRGNEITISGAPAETALVAELFEELTALLAGGAELTAGAVERIVRPRADRMSRDSTSAGRTPDFRRSMGMMRSTTAGVSSAPPPASAVISSNNSATRAVSAAVPVIVISFPRT